MRGKRNNEAILHLDNMRVFAFVEKCFGPWESPRPRKNEVNGDIRQTRQFCIKKPVATITELFFYQSLLLQMLAKVDGWVQKEKLPCW